MTIVYFPHDKRLLPCMHCFLKLNEHVEVRNASFYFSFPACDFQTYTGIPAGTVYIPVYIFSIHVPVFAIQVCVYNCMLFSNDLKLCNCQITPITKYNNTLIHLGGDQKVIFYLKNAKKQKKIA